MSIILFKFLITTPVTFINFSKSKLLQSSDTKFGRDNDARVHTAYSLSLEYSTISAQLPA